MQDLPDNTALLASVEAFLKDELLPELEGAKAFQTRVSANVLAMVRRHLDQACRDDGQQERDLLQQLTGRKGTLAGQTGELCRLIAEGELTTENEPLRGYLWLTTLNKLAVDQPGYSGYLRAREEWAARSESAME